MIWKKQLFIGISFSILLSLAYLLSINTFQSHRMGDWHFVLLIFGLVVIAIATITRGYKVMIATNLGYLIGFAFAILFGRDTFDPTLNYPHSTHNGWHIWTVTYLAFIAAGIVVEVAFKRFRKKKQEMLGNSRT